MERVDCQINDFLDKRKDKAQCTNMNESYSFIIIYNYLHDDFNKYFTSLKDCLEYNKITIPVDLTKENTLYLEQFVSKTPIKGFGKKLFSLIIEKAKIKGFKYIFCYPSNSLGGDKSNQDNLINKVYIPLGFIKLSSCIYQGYDMYTGEEMQFIEAKMKNIRVNQFDNNAPYHLMFAKIEDLKLETDIKVDVIYRKKYLKYKNKYLALKNNKL